MNDTRAFKRSPQSSGLSFTTKLSVARDAVEGVEAMMSTYTTYSKIKANMDAFNMYTELLWSSSDLSLSAYIVSYTDAPLLGVLYRHYARRHFP